MDYRVTIDEGSVRCFWKIDYYDRATEMGSPDPADPADCYSDVERFTWKEMNLSKIGERFDEGPAAQQPVAQQPLVAATAPKRDMRGFHLGMSLNDSLALRHRVCVTSSGPGPPLYNPRLEEKQHRDWPGNPRALSRCQTASTNCRRLRNCQATATAVRLTHDF